MARGKKCSKTHLKMQHSKAMCSCFEGTLAIPTVVRALHMPTSRSTPPLRKSFNFMPLFKKALTVIHLLFALWSNQMFKIGCRMQL